MKEGQRRTAFLCSSAHVFFLPCAQRGPGQDTPDSMHGPLCPSCPLPILPLTYACSQFLLPSPSSPHSFFLGWTGGDLDCLPTLALTPETERRTGRPRHPITREEKGCLRRDLAAFS